MTTPFVRQLRRIYPESDIQYWTSSEFLPALEGNSHVSKAIPFDGSVFYRRDITGALQLMRNLRRGAFDIGFFLGKHWFFNAFAAASGIPKRIGFAREQISRAFLTHAVTYNDLRHEIHYYLDLLKFVGAPDLSDVGMEVAVPAAVEDKAEALLSHEDLADFAGVINSGGNNAGENGFARRLPDDFFVNVVSDLARVRSVVLFGSEADREYYQRFKFPGEVRNFAGRLSFHESLAVMKRAAHIYTTDCGGMHVAATVNCNLTAFFCLAHPQRKAPLLGNVKVVWPDRVSYDHKRDLYNRPCREPFFRNINYSVEAI